MENKSQVYLHKSAPEHLSVLPIDDRAQLSSYLRRWKSENADRVRLHRQTEYKQRKKHRRRLRSRREAQRRRRALKRVETFRMLGFFSHELEPAQQNTRLPESRGRSRFP